MKKQKLSRPNRAIIALYDKGYRAKSDGTILKPTGKVQPLSSNQDKYKLFNVRLEGKQVCVFAHRFVAYQWMGDAIFEDEMFVLHINDIKYDNRIANLKLGDGKENFKDAKRNGIKTTRKNLDHDEIYRYYTLNGSTKTINNFEISQSTLRYVLKKYKNAESRITSEIPIPFYD